jgi:enamine deaminase RidA (YjgF/YER057c/UK114 family)
MPASRGVLWEQRTVRRNSRWCGTGHYAQAVVVPPSTSLVYVSGMLPIAGPMAGGAAVKGTIAEQVRLAISTAHRG